MEGKDTAGNTGTVSRRLKEKLAVEDIYGVEESEEVDTEKIEDCEIIDTEGNVISSTDSSDIGDWEKRHNEIEEQREKIRNRVRKTRSGNGVIREAKPKPTISDTGHKQVGVYARVSTKSTNQVSSIENQTRYYTKKVGDTPNWTLHEIYSDEGKSGTSTQHRTEFKRMIEDAAQKKIDLILCASVSRFARNMSDCMTLVRQLKSMNPSHPVLGRVAASDRGLILVFEMEEAIMFAPKKEEFVDPVTGETKKRQVKYYPDAYKNRIGRSYTEYEQYRQLNLFEDFGNYNKEQQPDQEEKSIENHMEGTEASMGATVPDYRIENQPQSNVNIEEGVDDNGNNEENTSTNLGITGQMGFH